MKKTLISLPVHESPECVENLIQNIYKYVPNSMICLHVSADYPHMWPAIQKFAKKYDGFLFINPKQYHTYKADEAANVTGLSSIHAFNFQYMDSITKFDNFAMETSNDFFVRRGIENTFEQFDCGFNNACKQTIENFPWPKVIENIKQVMEIKYAEKGSQEGFFMPAEGFKFVAGKIRELENKLGRMIDQEEIYIPTLLFNQFPELYERNSKAHYIYHNPNDSYISKHDCHKVMYGEISHIYGVKRVPRDPKNPTRIYLNEITSGP